MTPLLATTFPIRASPSNNTPGVSYNPADNIGDVDSPADNIVDEGSSTGPGVGENNGNGPCLHIRVCSYWILVHKEGLVVMQWHRFWITHRLRTMK